MLSEINRVTPGNSRDRGEQYAIKTDFRDILRYDEIIRGQSDGEAVLKAINILLGKKCYANQI